MCMFSFRGSLEQWRVDRNEVKSAKRRRRMAVSRSRFGHSSYWVLRLRQRNRIGPGLTGIQARRSAAPMNSLEQARDVRQIRGLADISDRYDVILCDIWGVLHNGVVSFATASQALVEFRRRGGAVVLISNAPRPSPPVCRQMLKLGISPETFDAIATSGDVSIGLIEERIDDPVLHIGPSRDLGLFDAAAEAAGRRPKLVALEEARYALFTGLRSDETETPQDYEPELLAMAARATPILCANPHVVIHNSPNLL